MLRKQLMSAAMKNLEQLPAPSPETAQPPAKQPVVSVSSSRKGLISLHADDLEARKALEIISRQANLNILVSPGVTGTLTVDLRDQTVDQALNAIATLCNLEIQQKQNFIYITTPDELRVNEADDLPVHVYRLNYVKSTDVEKVIKPILSEKGVISSTPDSEVGLQSDVTKAGDKSKDVKAGGNSFAGGDVIVIQDYEYVLKKVDKIVAELDVQPIQVLIEAVIVQVKLVKGMELGVNFSLLDGAGRAVGVVGNGADINAAAGFLPATVLQTGTNAGLLKGTPISGLAADSNGLKFGFVDKSTTGFIKALETVGETKVLASPRLLVLNKERAEIHLGDKLGYYTTTQTQTSTVQTVEFQDVGTQLRIRPFISSDGMIRMEVRPERSSGIIDGEGIPQVNTAQATTNVIVPDGATIVIGGLIEDEVVDKLAGLPLLSRLPWVGALFRETSTDTTKKELIVILTPHIWRPECPEHLNYIGRPRSLGLDTRVSQRPAEEKRDPASLFELVHPTCPAEGPDAAQVMPPQKR
jgi:general secretion pathway protein D